MPYSLSSAEVVDLEPGTTWVAVGVVGVVGGGQVDEVEHDGFGGGG